MKKSETCPPNKAKILNKMWTCQLNGKKIEDMVDKAIKKVKILHWIGTCPSKKAKILNKLGTYKIIGEAVQMKWL